MSRAALVRAVASLSLLAAPCWARAAEAGCRLGVVIEPAVVSPGRIARVRIVTGGAAPRLVASAGELRNLRRDGDDAFLADLDWPGQVGAEVAVVAAALDDGSCGFAAVRAGSKDARPRSGAAALLAVPPAIRASLAEEVRAYLFAVDLKGAPRAGPAPSFTASAGALSTPEPVAPGAWRVRWHIPPRESRIELVSARFPGEPAAAATIERVSRAVADVQIAFDRERARAGDRAIISIVARDAAGNGIDAAVQVDSDFGQIDGPVRTGEGRYAAALDVPTAVPRARAAFVQASVGGMTANASLPIAPAQAASVEVDGPAVAPADGSAVCWLAVAVLDGYGNPATEPPEVEAGEGEIGLATPVAPGLWVVEYRPRRHARDADDVVLVRAGPSSASHLVHLLAATPALSLAPRAGVALRTGGSALAIGAEASTWTRLGAEQVGLALQVDGWTVRRDHAVDGPGGAVSLRVDRRYLPLVASVAWRRPLGARASAWATLGGGAAWVSSTAALNGQPSLTEAGWVPAASAALALGLRALGGQPFAEVRWSWLGDPRLPTLRGSLSPVLLELGYRFDAP